jgi:hypothetical protein
MKAYDKEQVEFDIRGPRNSDLPAAKETPFVV